MKDRHLRVRPSACKRSFYLFKPEGSAVYHVRFTPPRWSFARAKLGLHRITRSTGTSEPAAAKDIAERIINSYWQAEQTGAVARENLTAQSEFATIGQLLERYEARAKERPRTIRCNANAMRTLVRTVHGGEPNERSTSVLTADLVRQFEEARTNASSTSSYLRQARSVIALRKMRFYSGLNLPDLTDFRAERVTPPRLSRPKPLEMCALVAMHAARAQLAESDPAVYVSNLMFSHWGMRNSEQLAARTWWITREHGGPMMHIIDRPEENYLPKGTERSFEIDEETLNEVLRFQYLCVDGYLIPGQHVTERRNAVNRRHSQWVSKWISNHRKTSYELRRYSGSRLLDLGATIYDVANFLGHRHVSTTENWYAYKLKCRKLPTIGMDNLVPKIDAA